MSRVQLALNVADLDEAIAFYSKLFATGPAKVRPGYANFAVADPPLKLVLIEDPPGHGRGTPQPPRGRGRHTADVPAPQARLAEDGLRHDVEEPTRPAATPCRTRSG